MPRTNRFLILGLVFTLATIVVSVGCTGQAISPPTPTSEPIVKTFPTPLPTATATAAPKSLTPASATSTVGGGTSAPASGDATAGRTTYNTTCSGCHPLGATGVGPNLAGVSPRLSDDQITQIIRAGKGIMPAFSQGQLNDAQLRDLTAYLKTLR